MWKRQRTPTKTKDEKKALHYTNCEKDGHDEEHYWKLHPELRPNKFGGKGKQNTSATMQQGLGSHSGNEEFITIVVLQGNHSFHASSSSYKPSHDTDKRRSELFQIRLIEKHIKI